MDVMDELETREVPIESRRYNIGQVLGLLVIALIAAVAVTVATLRIIDQTEREQDCLPSLVTIAGDTSRVIIRPCG